MTVTCAICGTKKEVTYSKGYIWKRNSKWYCGETCYNNSFVVKRGRPKIPYTRGKKSVYRGIEFDSKEEMDRYIFLERMLQNGSIRELLPNEDNPKKKKYMIVQSNKLHHVRPQYYTPDFEYILPDGTWVVEDYKGGGPISRDYPSKRSTFINIQSQDYEDKDHKFRFVESRWDRQTKTYKEKIF